MKDSIKMLNLLAKNIDEVFNSSYARGEPPERLFCFAITKTVNELEEEISNTTNQTS